MQPRADSAYGCAHRARNLLHLEIAVVAKDDGDSLVRAERPECAFQPFTLVDLPMGVMRGRDRNRSIQIVVASSSGTAKAVTARVDEDPAKPGVELVGVPKAAVLPPGSDERVVGGILGLLCVAEDQPGEAVRGVQPVSDERLEGGGTCRLRVRRDGSGFLAQAGLSYSSASPYRYRRARLAKHSRNRSLGVNRHAARLADGTTITS